MRRNARCAYWSIGLAICRFIDSGQVNDKPGLVDSGAGLSERWAELGELDKVGFRQQVVEKAAVTVVHMALAQGGC
jgi:hypothetical protein